MREAQEETQLSKYVDRVLTRSAIVVIGMWCIGVISFIMVKYL
jgi:hypothetical protein